MDRDIKNFQMEISIEANSNMGNQMGKENFKH